MQHIHAEFGFEIRFVPSGNSSMTLPYTRDKGALPWQPILGPKIAISKPNSAWICCIQLKLWPFFCDFWPILVKIWLPWQRPLDPCNQKCLVWVGQPRKPPVISNHILAISHRNAYKCISMRDSKNVITYNRGFSWSNNPKKIFLIVWV